MSTSRIKRGWLCSIAAVAFVASTGFAVTAQAGECPAGKMKANARQMVHLPGAGVTDSTLGAINLGKESAKLKGHELRFRKLVIQPGGVVPWHSHDERPALIYIAEGEIIEYASNCAAPIHHKAGEISTETRGTSHWWKNLGEVPAVLFAADVRRDPNDKNM
jgi:quercetin dioxygenase-like cupin family protein